MLDSLITKASELVAEMSTLEWVVAGAIAIMLVLGIVKQVAKLAIGAAVLAGVGLLLLNAQSQEWGWHISF